MKELFLNWTVGFTKDPAAAPEEFYPAQVPGAVQLDYARAKNWPSPMEGVNYKAYKWMEDVYWLYRAPLEFDAADDEIATLRFKGIDYRYQIRVEDRILVEDEGMFSWIDCDVTGLSGKTLEVLIWPSPKDDDSDTRTQARRSCKAAACYTWDWHPRLVTAGIWDEAVLRIQKRDSIRTLDVSYELSPNRDVCTLKAGVAVNQDCPVTVKLMDGEDVVAEAAGTALNGTAELVLTVNQPKLWYPVGYGEQHRYEVVAETPADRCSRKVGFRRSRLVMNEGSWNEPSYFPKSRSDAPATFEINGRRMFVKGSNWVNAQIFPGEMTEAHYDSLLTKVKDANMNILRIWGGGFINKESFFDLCDEKGIMIWEEFPLACNEYPDDSAYLAVLEKEAVNIVRRLRPHPCVVLWCGGNELFNNWSGMTDQHHALRLLDSICYREDRDTPFNMTSPLNGMAHGHYHNYDDEYDLEAITMFRRSANTAYTEFGAPGAADPDYIKRFISAEGYNDCNPDNEVWLEHHAFKAWQEKSWLRIPEVDYYFGGYIDVDDLCRKTQFIQAMSYKSNFEEMRKQWPHCAMALNWCLNEPWPTFANNSLISWPDEVRPAYYAVQSALRPQLASLRIDKHLWWAGETFQAGVWMLNDCPEQLDASEISVYYALGDGEEILCGKHYSPAVAPQCNTECGGVAINIPENFSGMLRIRLAVTGKPELDSVYTYPCRSKTVQTETVKRLNM